MQLAQDHVLVVARVSDDGRAVALAGQVMARGGIDEELVLVGGVVELRAAVRAPAVNAVEAQGLLASVQGPCLGRNLERLLV